MQSAILPLSLEAKTGSKKQFLVHAICYMAFAVYCTPVGSYAYRNDNVFMNKLVNMRLDLTMYNVILYRYTCLKIYLYRLYIGLYYFL